MERRIWKFLRSVIEFETAKAVYLKGVGKPNGKYLLLSKHVMSNLFVYILFGYVKLFSMACNGKTYVHSLHITLLLVALFLTIEAPFALAQGQGSYGGYASGLGTLVLIVILGIVLISLVMIRSILGNTVALISVGVIGLCFVFLFINSGLNNVKRFEAHKNIKQSLAEGCTMTSRSINKPANGNEPIFIRLHGTEVVPEFQRMEVVPSKSNSAKGVQIVTDLPQGLVEGIVIDIHYKRELVPGSYAGFEWYRTRYELTAQAISDGSIIAHTVDIEVSKEFCLGNLETFLTHALNRGEVLKAGEIHGAAQTQSTYPNKYVFGKYTQQATGKYLKSTEIRNTEFDAKQFLTIKAGCAIKETTHSAICGSHPNSVEISLNRIIGIVQLPSSWLLIRRVDKGITALTSMLVEQRGGDWQLEQVWHANAVPPIGNMDGYEYLEGFVFDGSSIVSTVYAGLKSGPDGSKYLHWYTERSILAIPLPNVRK